MPPNILDALSDPALFGPCFPMPAWSAWRAFLATLYGLPMSPPSLATFRACTGRQSMPRRPAREAWVICGRRSGKSRIASVIAAYQGSAVYLACPPLLTGQRCDLLDLPGLRAQLTALERRRRAGGRDVVDHLPGAHDAVANAAAGALVLAALRGAGDAGVLVCEREPSDLLATMIHEFGPIEPYFRE